jgi:hypothetical protein
LGWVDLGWVYPVRVCVLVVDPCWGVGVRVGLGGIGVLRVVEVKGTPVEHLYANHTTNHPLQRAYSDQPTDQYPQPAR